MKRIVFYLFPLVALGIVLFTKNRLLINISSIFGIIYCLWISYIWAVEMLIKNHAFKDYKLKKIIVTSFSSDYGLPLSLNYILASSIFLLTNRFEGGLLPDIFLLSVLFLGFVSFTRSIIVYFQKRSNNNIDGIE